MENFIGRKIARRLRALNQTQVWLAAQVDVSNNAVTKWIKSGQISVDKAMKVATALEITLDELVDDTLILPSEKEDQHAEVQPARQQEEQPVSSPAKVSNDLLLAHVTVEEMRLVTFCRTYPEAGKTFHRMAADLTGNPTMK